MSSRGHGQCGLLGVHVTDDTIENVVTATSTSAQVHVQMSLPLYAIPVLLPIAPLWTASR